jgi:hypothetical protein
MQLAGTVVVFASGGADGLDPTALSLDVLDCDFRRIKQAHAGSLLFVLCPDAHDPALAAAAKVARILRKTAIVALPPLEADPGPQATARLERAARLTQACVVQPVAATWADAVRCFVEPLAVFGLVGVDPREIHGLVRPRVALLHQSIDRVLPRAREVLVTCRLRPNASLREVDDAARAVAERAPQARLVLAGPEVGDDAGPRLLAASFL